MSSTANNLPFVPGNWRSGNDYAWSRPSAPPPTFSNNPGGVREGETENWRSGSNSDARVPNNYWNRPPHAPPYIPHEMNRGAPDHWRLFEDRVRTEPYGLNGFPSYPFSPMRIVVLGDEMAPEVNPRLRQFIQESPPRIRAQWNTQQAPEEDESRLTREEQKKALKKLKKKVYNPYPKNKNTSWCLYYRDNSSLSKREEEMDDDSKSCAICLEDFVPKQEVLVTPCNHMFHEDCIVRWVKSNGQCPVCRFTIGERGREAALPINNAHLGAPALPINNNYARSGLPINNVHSGAPALPINNNYARSGANDLMAVDLISLLRDMEEAFQWVQIPR